MHSMHPADKKKYCPDCETWYYETDNDCLCNELEKEELKEWLKEKAEYKIWLKKFNR